MSDKKVLKKHNGSKKSAMSAGVSVQSTYEEENLKLLIALGANEEERAFLLKRHPEFCELTPPPYLMESVRLFEEYGMDSRVFMRVLVKHNWWIRTVFLHTPPHKPKRIYFFETR